MDILTKIKLQEEALKWARRTEDYMNGTYPNIQKANISASLAQAYATLALSVSEEGYVNAGPR